MTNDYKERIIKWLTGNYTISHGYDDPQFQELISTTSNISDYIEYTLGYIQGRDGKGNELDVGFIYGIDSNNKNKIIIVDNDFNIIQVIDSFDTGTSFRSFICLNIDTTNGNIYGVDLQGSQYRFILLNNFLVKTPSQNEYEVKLRNSYNLTFSGGFAPDYVEKRPSDSLYVMTCLNNGKPMTATYKIEVGSTNELIQYTYSGSALTNYSQLKAYNIAWSGEEYVEKIGVLNYIEENVNQYDMYYVEYSFNGTTITKTYTIEVDYLLNNIHQIEIDTGVEMNNNNTYVYYNDEPSSYIRKIDYQNNNTILYYSITGDTTLNYTWTNLKLKKQNNSLYFYAMKNIDDPNDNTQTEFNICFGQILENDNKKYIVSNLENGGKLYNIYAYRTNEIFYLSNVYNLYSYNLTNSKPIPNENNVALLNIKQIFNSLNYNYDDYQDINSMVPNSVWLYSNNEIVFARNLYNKTLNGNITISTVEIPNMMLNDISITPQKLLGQTNGVLINNTEEITKNIYEDLFINFYNELTMQNQNTQDYITNLNGATRLNASISNTMDYNNAKISAIRLNYSDDTTYTKTISPATQISQFVYQIKFQIYVPNNKTITSIELISADEQTSYQTINTSNLESGKTYKITQNVEIGE